MTDFKFFYFAEYEDGKLAHLETYDSKIPVNIYAEPNSDFSLKENECCSVDILGVCSEIKYYENEEEFVKADTVFDVVSMIPIGTFPLDEDENFEESPYIIFTGKIIAVDTDPTADSDEPNYFVTLETLEMTVTLLFNSDENISVGGILHGVAWLYGDILRKTGN